MKTLCFIIHGIGVQDNQYSNPLQNGIHNKLKEIVKKKQSEDRDWDKICAEDLVDFHPIYWADIGSNEQNNLYRNIFPDLFGTKNKAKKFFQFLCYFPAVRSLSINLIGDVFGYLGRFQQPIKRKVYKELSSALNERIQKSEKFSIIIISHSLGSVILYDLLSSLLRYKFVGFESLVSRTSVFTMGSPISLFSLVSENINPNKFRNWVNFSHSRDPIAFPISKLNKSVKDIKLRKLYLSPFKFHTGYWTNSKVHTKIAEEIARHHDEKVAALASPKISGVVPPPEVFQIFNEVTNKDGFSDYIIDLFALPYKELIANAKQIDILNIYAQTWIKTNAQYFIKALSNAETSVRVCSLSKDSPALDGYCYHFDRIDGAELAGRIENVTSEWKKIIAQLNEKNKGSLHLYKTPNIIGHSFYRFDDVMYFVPRGVSSDKHAATPIPVLVYRKTSHGDDFYSWVMKDFENVIKTNKDSSLDYHSPVANVYYLLRLLLYAL